MMKITRISGATLALAFVATAWMAGPAQAQTSSAEALQNAMKKCAAIADEGARHICSDAVLEGAGLLAPEAPAAAAGGKAAERAATPAAPESAAQAPVAQTPAQPAVKSEPSKSANLTESQRDSFFPEEKKAREDEEEINEIEVTLQDVSKYGNGKFVLTDTEGMTWRQLYTRSTLLPPKSGQSMTVRKNTLGGYMCRVEKSPSFRCSPVS